MRFLKNYLSTLAFIGLAWWIITDLSGFHRTELQAQWHLGVGVTLSFRTLVLGLMALYAVVLIPYYLRYPWIRSKAWVFLQGLRFAARRLSRPWSLAWRRRLEKSRWNLTLRMGISPRSKQAGLALLLKFFFAPLMINWCLAHVADMGGSLLRFFSLMNAGVSGLPLFDVSYWACFQLILFIDTLLFTMGYIIELPALRNRIRSVDPTVLGWLVCLLCYPPVNLLTGYVLGWQSSDAPQFSSLVGEWSQQAKTAVHIVAGLTILLLMVVFSWASIALGFKASNLTNRGIVSRGPYAFVRHPAYTVKNLAWWIGAIPTVYLIFHSGNIGQGVLAILATLGWTAIYVLRALTEERHLLMGNNGYAEYKSRVRWRFIPGVC